MVYFSLIEMFNPRTKFNHLPSCVIKCITISLLRYFISICKNASIFFVFRLHLSSYACYFLLNCISSISSDQTGQGKFALFGSFDEQVVGRHIIGLYRITRQPKLRSLMLTLLLDNYTSHRQRLLKYSLASKCLLCQYLNGVS
jgi:hypothetical protein